MFFFHIQGALNEAKLGQFKPGADPASKFREGRYQNNIWWSSLIRGFTTVREMNYISQHCCDKTTDGRIALNCE